MVSEKINNFLGRKRSLLPSAVLAVSKGKPDLHLQGIAKIGDKRIVIIDGRSYQEGEEVEGAQIIKIDKDKVLLKKEGRYYQLNIEIPSRGEHNASSEKGK